MFHLLAYNAALGVNAADTALAGVADPIFSRRGTNNNFIFTQRYRILGAFYHAASATRARLNSPTLNAIGRMQVWPVERSATIPDDPGWLDVRPYPVDIPQNEEVGVEGSNDLGAATEQSQMFLWVAPPSHDLNLPRGQQRLIVRATGAVAGVAQSWSGLGNIVFAENLRGGWYTLLGAQCFDAGTLALRFIFPAAQFGAGSNLRPGILCQEAIGNKPLPANMGGFGAMGRFHSFEPPQIEIFANATAASAQEIRLDLVYHGDGMPAGM